MIHYKKIHCQKDQHILNKSTLSLMQKTITDHMRDISNIGLGNIGSEEFNIYLHTCSLQLVYTSCYIQHTFMPLFHNVYKYNTYMLTLSKLQHFNIEHMKCFSLHLIFSGSKLSYIIKERKKSYFFNVIN